MLDPFLRGGNMIKEVNKISSSWNDAPWKFEAGTANIAQVLGLATAIEYLNKLGIINIKKHNNQLLEYLLLKMKIIEGIKIYGHQNKSGPIVSFNIDGCHPYDIAKLLDNYGICIRSGHHCAQLLMKNLKINYANRISLHIYNTTDEIDYFTENLNKVVRLLKK
jgi:cysteine desulfurase/selenocysteine lyase